MPSDIRIRIHFSPQTRGLEDLARLLARQDGRVQSMAVLALLRRAMSTDGAEDIVRSVTGDWELTTGPSLAPKKTASNTPKGEDLVKKMPKTTGQITVRESHVTQQDIIAAPPAGDSEEDVSGIDIDQAIAVTDLL